MACVAAACGDAEPAATATTAPATTVASGRRAPLGVAKVPPPTPTTIVPTTVPTTTTTTTLPPVAVGTVDNPVALGSPRLIGDWVITVVAVDADAESAVLEENPFNDPAAAGERFVKVDIEMSYVGQDTGWPWIEIDHWMLGEDNILYKGLDSECGVLPHDLSFVGEVFPGGSVVGSLCHRVSAADADRAVMVVEESFSFGESDAAVFALHEGVGSEPDEPLPPVPPTGVGGPLGSLGNPIELNSPGMIGDWRVSVVAVDVDAADLVRAENQFNDAPDPGSTYVLVTVEAEYEGSDSGDPWFDIRAKLLGLSRVAYEGFEAYCGVIPDDFTAVGETEAGKTIRGNLCWEVAESDLASLVLILEDNQSFDGGRLFYALG